jgi:hypothetical protein
MGRQPIVRGILRDHLRNSLLLLEEARPTRIRLRDRRLVGCVLVVLDRFAFTNGGRSACG